MMAAPLTGGGATTTVGGMAGSVGGAPGSEGGVREGSGAGSYVGWVGGACDVHAHGGEADVRVEDCHADERRHYVGGGIGLGLIV